MNCPKCGWQLGNNSGTCEKCGAKIGPDQPDTPLDQNAELPGQEPDQAEAAAQKPAKSSSPVGKIIIVVVILVVLAVLGWFARDWYLKKYAQFDDGMKGEWHADTITIDGEDYKFGSPTKLTVTDDEISYSMFDSTKAIGAVVSNENKIRSVPYDKYKLQRKNFEYYTGDKAFHFKTDLMTFKHEDGKIRQTIKENNVEYVVVWEK